MIEIVRTLFDYLNCCNFETEKKRILVREKLVPNVFSVILNKKLNPFSKKTLKFFHLEENKAILLPLRHTHSI